MCSDELQSALLTAIERCAVNANSFDKQELSNTLWALAELQWPVAGALRAQLSRAACSLVHEMNAQNVSNSLWAQAWFTVATGEALDIDPSTLFARAAELHGSLLSQDKSQVSSAVLIRL